MLERPAQIPSELLTCEAEPVIERPATPDSTARYMVNLRFAGKSCRDHLDEVRRVMASE